MVWGAWWNEQALDEPARIAYFRLDYASEQSVSSFLYNKQELDEDVD